MRELSRGASGTARWSRFIASLYVVELTPEIARGSITRLARYALRTGDAVQLACCAYLRDLLAGDVQLLAYDTRLNQAARAERIVLLALPQ
jgi:predicted nucleic acid-binding protein